MIRLRTKNFLGLLLCLATLIYGSAAIASDANKAEWIEASATITGATETMLAVINDTELSDPQAKVDALKREITKHVDYAAIAKGVMAKYYRRASGEEFERFVDVFTQSLEKIYAKGLLAFEIESYSLVDYSSDDGRRNRERVTIAVTANGSVFEITYTMKKRNDRWQIVNVDLNGVNVGLAFRNQFVTMMGEQGNDIGKVIDAWNQ